MLALLEHSLTGRMAKEQQTFDCVVERRPGLCVSQLWLTPRTEPATYLGSLPVPSPLGAVMYSN